jgi:hypothetical protein
MLITHALKMLIWFLNVLVKWVPCHGGIARPQVADREDGLQV